MQLTGLRTLAFAVLMGNAAAHPAAPIPQAGIASLLSEASVIEKTLASVLTTVVKITDGPLATSTVTAVLTPAAIASLQSVEEAIEATLTDYLVVTTTIKKGPLATTTATATLTPSPS